MHLELSADTLQVHLSPLERLLAIHPGRTLTLPLRAIGGVQVGVPGARHLRLRAPGTALPFVVRAGTFYGKRGREFWYAPARRACLQVEVAEGPYRHLVLAVEAPEEWALRLSRAKAGGSVTT
jgi:hypothetical protein